MENFEINASEMLKRTVKAIVATYTDELKRCYDEIEKAVRQCKSSTEIEMSSSEITRIMKIYFIYMGYAVRTVNGKFEISWGINFNGKNKDIDNDNGVLVKLV